MYDADFNAEGFGVAPAMPYGVHGMDRSDTNVPTVFPGGVTAADPYANQITADIAIAGGPSGPVSAYGAADVFADPNPSGKGYVYAVDPTNGAITIVKAPAGRYTGQVQKGTPAYNAIYSLYLGQRKQGIAGTLQTATTQIAQAFTPTVPVLDVTALSQASTARMDAARAALSAPAQAPQTPNLPAPAPATTLPTTPTPSSGMSWTTWAILLGGVGLAFYLYTKRSR
jgi:hypothetical protein